MVIDPNVWVSAVINPYGTLARVVDTVASGEIVAVLTQHLLDELTAVLVRPNAPRLGAVRLGTNDARKQLNCVFNQRVDK